MIGLKQLGWPRDALLEVSGLTCDSGWPAEDHDLANKDALNRQKAVDYFQRQIECVKVVGGDYLIVVPSAVGKFRSMGAIRARTGNGLLNLSAISLKQQRTIR